jgi:hypothetical protein
MTITRWSNNSGILVPPQAASVWLGRFDIPVPSGTSDFNVWSAINADFGAVLAVRPAIDILQISWQVVISLSVPNISSISAYGGNPPRYKLGSATYAQGSFSLDYEPINYPFSLLKQQQFIFGEALPEPSVGVISVPQVPTAFEFITTPNGGLINNVTPRAQNFGATRIQFLLNPGIIGVASVSYTALDSAGAFVPLNSSIVVSQL